MGRRTSLIAAVALAACALGTTTANAATPPIKHVWILILENKNYEEIVRQQLAGAVPGRHAARPGPAARQLLRDHAPLARQLHRPGQRPGLQSGDAGRQPGVHGRLPGDHRRRRPGDRAGLRLPARGQDDRRPAGGQEPDLARLHGGHGERGQPAQDMPPPRTPTRRTPRRARAWATSTPPATTRSSTSTRSSTTRGAATPTTSRSTALPNDLQVDRDDAQLLLHHAQPVQRRPRRAVRRRQAGRTEERGRVPQAVGAAHHGLAGLQAGGMLHRHLRRGRGDGSDADAAVLRRARRAPTRPTRAGRRSARAAA